MRNTILQELHAEYEQRQQANQREEAFRRMQAEAACPEIGQVLEARQNLIFGTLRGILDGKASAEDIPSKMDVLNKRLTSLLKQHGFAENYLDPVCQCPVCGDTGYVGEIVREHCECFNQAFYARMYQRMGLSESTAQSFEAFDLNVFSSEKLPSKTYSQRELMNVIRKTCEQYAENYPAVPVKDMLLMGQSGLGKTFLMHAMAKKLIQRGQNVLLISAYKFLDVARKAYMSGNVEELDALMDADVLMIDDMGVEPLMENITIPQWFNLINERQLRGKGTILSTNLMEDELRRRYTERIASRLMNNTQCRLVQFAGGDVRRAAR
ncbi:MAG: ATP-binding protein [Clostridia bacterium]|nr:ATP-binding protein [Clostridia bacterium]